MHGHWDGKQATAQTTHQGGRQGQLIWDQYGKQATAHNTLHARGPLAGAACVPKVCASRQLHHDGANCTHNAHVARTKDGGHEAGSMASPPAGSRGKNGQASAPQGTELDISIIYYAIQLLHGTKLKFICQNRTVHAHSKLACNSHRGIQTYVQTNKLGHTTVLIRCGDKMAVAYDKQSNAGGSICQMKLSSNKMCAKQCSAARQVRLAI